MPRPAPEVPITGKSALVLAIVNCENRLS